MTVIIVIIMIYLPVPNEQVSQDLGPTLFNVCSADTPSMSTIRINVPINSAKNSRFCKKKKLCQVQKKNINIPHTKYTRYIYIYIYIF